MNKKPKNNVFMCLDVNTYSFSSSTYGNTKGVVILVLFTIGYWVIAFSFLNLFMVILDTVRKTKPLTIYLIVYLLIAQKLIRAFIINEKELLEQFMESSRRNIVTLGEFYDIKSSGYEKQVRINPNTGREQEYHKVLFKNGVEEYVVKFLRGSITSEFADTETSQIRLTCNFINSLMLQGIVPRIVISDERIERATVFKFYQHKLKTGKFDEEFVDLCNSTLMYHENNAELYSRITSNYFFIPSITTKQKIFMDNFCKSIGSNVKFSTFRDITLLNKQQILNIYKDLNALNTINELALQTEEAKQRVPLGLTKTLFVRNVITGEIKELSKDESKLSFDITDIDYQVLRKVGDSQNQETIKSSTTDSTDNINYQSIEDLISGIELPELEENGFLLDSLESEESNIDKPKSNTLRNNNEITSLIEDGVFNFNHIDHNKTTIDKSVMLLNTLQDDNCKVIIL